MGIVWLLSDSIYCLLPQDIISS